MSCNFASTHCRLKCGWYADRLCEGAAPGLVPSWPDGADSGAGAAGATAE
jgi:hypothetical protein